jgi:hypothetical protein
VSTPMYEIPEHLAMPINGAGQGPETDPELVTDTVCWCGEEGCQKWRKGTEQ